MKNRITTKKARDVSTCGQALRQSMPGCIIALLRYLFSGFCNTIAQESVGYNRNAAEVLSMDNVAAHPPANTPISSGATPV